MNIVEHLSFNFFVCFLKEDTISKCQTIFVDREETLLHCFSPTYFLSFLQGGSSKYACKIFYLPTPALSFFFPSNIVAGHDTIWSGVSLGSVCSKHSTIKAATIKFMAAKTGTVLALYSILIFSCSGPTLSNTSPLGTTPFLSFDIFPEM